MKEVNYTTIRRCCRRCGRPVDISRIEPYPYECRDCDENLFKVETEPVLFVFLGSRDEPAVGEIRFHVGDHLSAKNPLGFTGHYVVRDIDERQGVYLTAVGETLREIEAEYEHLKEKNWFCPDVRSITLEALASMRVEAAWFGNRKIAKED